MQLSLQIEVLSITAAMLCAVCLLVKRASYHSRLVVHVRVAMIFYSVMMTERTARSKASSYIFELPPEYNHGKLLTVVS